MIDEKTNDRATCPFCGAAWTDAMLDAFDAMTDNNCSCCSPESDHRHDHAPAADLCCDGCGRAIYRALASIGR